MRGDDEHNNDPSSQQMAAGLENLFTPVLGNSSLLRWSRLPKVPPTPCPVWYRTSRRPVQFNGSPTSMPTQHNIDLLSPSVTSFNSTIAEGLGVCSLLDLAMRDNIEAMQMISSPGVRLDIRAVFFSHTPLQHGYPGKAYPKCH
jgi:hypothetical protein